MAQPRDTEDVRRDDPKRNDLDRDQPMGRGDEQTAGTTGVPEDDEAFEEEEEHEEEGDEKDEI